MVTKMRSTLGGAGSPSRAAGGGGFPFASGGASDGQRKARSTRSCAPGRRCTGTRMAAGGRLKATPATVTGSAGASAPTGGPGQRGHST
jgi:hypothetical protein